MPSYDGIGQPALSFRSLFKIKVFYGAGFKTDLQDRHPITAPGAIALMLKSGPAQGMPYRSQYSR